MRKPDERVHRGRGLTRARFLAGMAGVGVAAGGLPAGSARAAGGGAGGGAVGAGGGLGHRGVVYTVGEGETPGTAFAAARMRRDMAVIRDRLHADTVEVTGDGVERLTATAGEAAERGLRIWLQPTLGDVPGRDILEHL